MGTDPVCPCDDVPGAKTITNPPGRDRIAYRVGDFLSFRRALLNAPEDPFAREQQLSDWRPTAQSDLGVLMLEWWAYLADILAFYNERIANESYLRTASRPESLRRLIRTLGYRPRPGIAAHGTLAALVGGHRPLTLPRGFSIDSKPAPGVEPQTFELDADTVVKPEGAVPADPPAYAFSPDTGHFLLAGARSPLKPGSAVMLDGRTPGFQPLLLLVTDLRAETGADGSARTRVAFKASGTPPADVSARDLVLLQPSQSIPASSIDASAVSPTPIHLAGLARDIHAGDFVLVRAPGHDPQLREIASVTDAIWYANHKTGANPAVPPDSPSVPIAVLHSVLTFVTPLTDWPSTPGATTVGYGWRSAGELLDQPVATYAGPPATLVARAPATFPADGGQSPILVADAAGAGMAGKGTSADGQTLAVSSLPQPPVPLRTPLTVHFNLLDVSRGKTVSSEVLGSGDASAAGQSFVLRKSPLTYRAKGDCFASTLQVWVSGRQWQEAASFFDQPADAEIFVTSEDDEQKTTVTFGDGLNGARLPTGVNNVVASYRYGSGAQAPPAGALTVIGKPYPNLRSLQNPVAVGGGSDPDSPQQIRRLAPRSAMTFGRAISGDDYQVIAAQAPGVTRTQAVWSFDADEQRSAVKIYVGDDQAALDSARAAIAPVADPHRHVIVAAATPITVTLSLRLLRDALHQGSDVQVAVSAALLDDDRGLFGTRRLGIGEAVFDSQISAACLACEGVVAVHDIQFAIDGSIDATERHAPGEGAFYRIDPTGPDIRTEVTLHGR